MNALNKLKNIKVKKFNPYITIIFTFISVILIGTVLLMLPIASKSGESFGIVDSLFMSTSAVCVTGLGVINIGTEMSAFGKVVMMLLMEIGGLSIITIAVFFFTILGGKISASNKFLLRESLNQNAISGVVPLVKRIIVASLVIQLIGAIINGFSLYSYYNGDIIKTIEYSVFHSVASFNNAGFDAFGGDSLIEFKDNILLNSSTMFLIISGGIGFVVMIDIIRNKRFKKFSLHTKLVLLTTFFLITLGMVAIKFTSDMSWLQALFTSVTSRTAGFSTYDMSTLNNHPAAYIIIIVLMIIGASPCSTGGGIKTTTVAIAFLAIVYYAIGKKTKAFQRKISEAQIFKCFALITMAIFIVIVGSIVVSSVQPELGLDKIIFEVVSAFSTTGLSMGITSSLNSFNRVFLCVLMLFGRLGPLTIIGIVNKNWMSQSDDNIKYIEESVIIG